MRHLAGEPLLRWGVLLGVAAGVACESTVLEPGLSEFVLEEVVAGLQAPIHLAVTPIASDQRLFISEQRGVIRIVEDGTPRTEHFLDIRDRVVSGGERGLFSMAFHPGYESNGYFYVSYTGAGGTSHVERYTVSVDADIADIASAFTILTVAQPFSNHNGGQIAFGDDGMLYIGLGDGGSSGDPQGHGQNTATLLGSMLRIDVDGGSPYAIPPDNPFAGSTNAQQEIWAWGLRNPWRWSFDRPSGLLYLSDVGQSRREEINVVAADEGGVNYGWAIMEGDECYQASTCDQTGLTLPVHTYATSEGCAVVGGYVYRGSAIPELAGHYVYSDHCGRWLRSFRYQNGQATSHAQWGVSAPANVLSLGQDRVGEVYVLGQNGRIWRVAKGPAS